MVTKQPTVAVVGGGAVAVGILRTLCGLRDQGLCDLRLAIPTNLKAGANADVSAVCRQAGVALGERLSDLEGAEPLDLVFSAGNHKLFTERQIATATLGIVNFHAAPLPKYRGSACPAFAILNGERDFGVTFHRVVAALDAGPILHLETFAIDPDATAGELDRACVEKGMDAFRRIAPALLRGALPAIPQPVQDTPPYKRSDIEAHRKIDPAWPPDRIWRTVRACDWDGVLKPAFFEIAGHPVFLTARPRGTSM